MKNILILTLLLFSTLAQSATLLPNGRQQFVDGNGKPLARGSVYFYVPGTTTPKTTWQDSSQNTANTNPVVLDGNGYGTIYGSGAYRQILKNAAGVTIWDTLTADTSANGPQWAGTSTGSANAQDVSAAAFTATDGQSISFVSGYTNTASVTLIVNGTNYSLYKDTNAGPVALGGAEIVSGTIATVVYDQTLGGFHLVSQPFIPTVNNAAVTVSSGTVTDLGASGSTNVIITGSATITSFGSSASISRPYYYITFSNAGALAALVQNDSTSLILPGGGDLKMASGDTLIAQYLGSGNWQVVNYQRTADNGTAPGAIQAIAYNNCQSGWLEANGAAISRTTYPGLFAQLGTTWGAGDGSTTFNIPDFRGQFLRGWDHGAGVDPGRAFASSQTDNVGAFTETLPASSGGGGTPAGVVIGVQNAGTVSFSIGSGQTQPKNYAILYCVKF